jgi:hypothetical protein
MPRLPGHRTANGSRSFGATPPVRANGGGVRFLVRGTQPDWSSRGALTFLGTGGLQVRLPGGKTVKLGVIGGDPSWAPSGNRLAFVGQPEGPTRGPRYARSTRTEAECAPCGTQTTRRDRTQDPWRPLGLQTNAGLRSSRPWSRLSKARSTRSAQAEVRIGFSRPDRVQICIENPNFIDLSWQSLRR